MKERFCEERLKIEEEISKKKEESVEVEEAEKIEEVDEIVKTAKDYAREFPAVTPSKPISEPSSRESHSLAIVSTLSDVPSKPLQSLSQDKPQLIPPRRKSGLAQVSFSLDRIINT